jgi:hypothetical protein
MSRCPLAMLQIRSRLALFLRRTCLTCQLVCQSEDGATAASILYPRWKMVCLGSPVGNGDPESPEVGSTDEGVVNDLPSLWGGMAVTVLPSIGGQRVLGDLRRADSLARRGP